MPIGAIKASSYHSRLAEHQVKLLLEALTTKPDGFNEISDRVVAWANTSERERDGRTMIAVIRAIVTTLSTGDTTRSEVYGRLCRKLMDGVSLGVRDDELVDTDGKPVSGPQLFRKYLLNRCQEIFEKFLESMAEGDVTPRESEVVQPSTNKQAISLSVLCSFMGELFKQGMLAERVMHECLKALLGNMEGPGEEQLEGLCSFLNSIGARLDIPAARAHMDIYFQRVETFSTNPQVELRMRGKLKEIIQLRERKWDGKQMARLRLSRR
ncbi:armadillo-type protein [Ephemerocybe angulata]|uniref:Armadillo-type protein n=1 Tax=Ephemerocybe angulata TaxID=980116 RepID=A0A8H6I9N5_9AGAR|nr:armadillo-type protein [Tulosesus angulatus]